MYIVQSCKYTHIRDRNVQNACMCWGGRCSDVVYPSRRRVPSCGPHRWCRSDTAPSCWHRSPAQAPAGELQSQPHWPAAWGAHLPRAAKHHHLPPMYTNYHTHIYIYTHTMDEGRVRLYNMHTPNTEYTNTCYLKTSYWYQMSD